MFPLHPETPAEGRSLEELFRTTPEKIAAMMTGLSFRAIELGLPFGPRKATYNTRLAQELGIWAEEMGQGDSYHQAVFRAYFADGANLGQPEVLLGIIRRLGLNPEDAAAVLTSRSRRQQVDLDWQEARERQITAVPTFLCGEERLVGAVDLASLISLSTAHGARRREQPDNPS